MNDIEFTDRYGGSPPSWLRGCHGDCEAMGYVPVSRNNIELHEEWKRAHAQPHEEQCDGWHFVLCPDCKGTGRVSWAISVARIPRWLWKGARFIWTANRYPGKAPWQSRWQHYRTLLWAAYGADLQRLRR